MYVCICKAVSGKEIEQVIGNGATSFEEIQGETGAASCCGMCEPRVRAHLDDVHDASSPQLEPVPA